MDSGSEEQTVFLSNGRCMPIIGLGAFQIEDEEAVDNAISSAIDAGYRHFDTAFTYGNEHLIGQALQKMFKEGKVKREELFITSKLPPNGMQPNAVEHFFQISRNDLQMQYIDLYLIHTPMAAKRHENDRDLIKDEAFDADESVDLVQTWKELEKLVSKGYVKSLGFSNFNSKQIKRIYDSATIKPVVLQVECHAYLPQFELQEFCQSFKIAMTAYSPFGAPYEMVFKNKELKGIKLLEDPNLKPLCKKHEKSPAQILLRYLVQREIIVIPKSSNEKRIRENIEIFDFTLSEDDIEVLKSMACNARFFDFRFPKGLAEHPEYPFNIPF